MKAWLALCLVSCSVLATPKEELAQRLSLSDGFSAQFEQTVTDAEGNTINHAQGKVDISRPSLFRWETLEPDETLIVSDGASVWYYTPFIEQVSIYDQAQVTAQTPFVLLTRNDPADWIHYSVSQQGDTFTLNSMDTSQTQGQFHIMIDKQGQVGQFDVLEQDGQLTQFVFNHIKDATLDADLFSFKVPNGVDIDDQRN